MTGLSIEHAITENTPDDLPWPPHGDGWALVLAGKTIARWRRISINQTTQSGDAATPVRAFHGRHTKGNSA